MLNDQFADVMEQPRQVFHARSFSKARCDTLRETCDKNIVEPKPLPIDVDLEMRKGVDRGDSKSDAASLPNADERQSMLDAVDRPSGERNRTGDLNTTSRQARVHRDDVGK